MGHTLGERLRGDGICFDKVCMCMYSLTYLTIYKLIYPLSGSKTYPSLSDRILSERRCQIHRKQHIRPIAIEIDRKVHSLGLFVDSIGLSPSQVRCTESYSSTVVQGQARLGPVCSFEFQTCLSAIIQSADDGSCSPSMTNASASLVWLRVTESDNCSNDQPFLCATVCLVAVM
jgi:hypothetical protein